jgi:hypothetical protein
VNDEFRAEVDVASETDAERLGERLRGLDLDDGTRARLGGRVLATRDGTHLFLYAPSDAQAREIAELVQSLSETEGVTAEVRVTRWHPIEETWKDASLPLPRTAEEEETEYAAREAAEADEAEREGQYDWHVVVHLSARDEAVELARRLEAEGVSVAQRWRYVVAGVLTEERAEELAERMRTELPDEAEVSVEANLSDVRVSNFQFLPFC